MMTAARSAARLVGVVLFLAAVLCAHVRAGQDSSAMEDASEFEAKLWTSRAFLGLNNTCFRLCQLGKLPEQPTKQPAAAAAASSGTQSVHGSPGPASKISDGGSSGGGGSTTVDAAAFTYVPSTAIPAAARHLLQASGSTSNATTTINSTTTTINSTSNATTTNSTSSTTTVPATSLVPVTACAAAIDPQAAALLASRYRAFKVNLAMSDFWELFYSIGNLWYAIDDLLKQGLQAIQSGHIEVNAASIMLFNQNIAGVTAWWGNLVQNLLLFAADATAPLPTDTLESN